MLHYADAAGLHLAGPGTEAPDTVVDLLVDGVRAWSFPLAGTTPSGTGRRLAAWPPALAERLDGVATLELRDARDHAPLGRTHARFGNSPDPVDLSDRAGRRLAVNKWGRLGPAFEGRDDDVAPRLLDTLEGLLAHLEAAGLEPFVTYGTLLGAVRQGDLLPHDDDADVAYLSHATDPCDVVLESFDVERGLVAAGYEVVRHSGGHLQVVVRKDGDVDHYVDVFTCFVVEGSFHQAFHVRAPADEVTVHPRGTVRLAGRTLPAPARPEQLLVACYGGGWATPDPSFRFVRPERTSHRFSDWLGDLNMHLDYWQDFYAGGGAERVPADPSPFARWAGERLPAGIPVLEVGFGTGRDAVFLAANGHRVLGVDAAQAGVRLATERARQGSVDATFRCLNLNDRRAVLGLLADVGAQMPGAHVYARFLVHAVEDVARENLWLLCSGVARTGGQTWLEFRTGKDEGQPHEFGEHFRRYLDPQAVVDEAGSHGLAVLEQAEGHGLAPYGAEDPHVARLRLGALS